jgi:transcriptional regulator with XRE-family HTH domain
MMAGMAPARRPSPQNPGDVIRLERHRRRWSQAQLAQRLGVDRKTVDNWENSRTSPRGMHVTALQDVLGISLGDGLPQPASKRESVRAKIDRIVELAEQLQAQIGEEDDRNDDNGRNAAGA